MLKGPTRSHFCENDGCASAEAFVVDTGHEVTFTRDQSFVWQEGDNPSAESVERTRGTSLWRAVCDGIDRYHAAQLCMFHWDQGLKTMRTQEVILRSVSETQWHENRNSGVRQFLFLTMSWQRKPRNGCRRCSGTDRLDQHQWNVKNIADHTSRAEAGVHACIAGRGRARPHSMRNESETGLASWPSWLMAGASCKKKMDCKYMTTKSLDEVSEQ